MCFQKERTVFSTLECCNPGVAWANRLELADFPKYPVMHFGFERMSLCCDNSRCFKEG